MPTRLPHFGHFTVFVLACFVGYMVVWNVTPAAAHAADERDQRDLQHHRHRRAGAGRTAAVGPARPDGLILWLAFAAIVLTPSTCSAALP